MDNKIMFTISKVPLPPTNKKPFWSYYNCARHVEIKSKYFKFRDVLKNTVLTVVDESYDTILRTILDEYISKNHCQDDEIYQLFVLFFEQQSVFEKEQEYKIEPFDDNKAIKYPDIVSVVQGILGIIEPDKIPNFLDYHFKRYNGDYAINFLVHTLEITNGLWKTTIKDIDRQVKFKEWILKTAEYLRQIITVDSETIIQTFEEVFLNNQEDEILESFKERVHLFFEPIEEEEEPVIEKGVYDLPEDFVETDFEDMQTSIDWDIKSSVPKKISKEKSFWVYNNIVRLDFNKILICEVVSDYEEEEDQGFEYISEIHDEDDPNVIVRERLKIVDKKYETVNFTELVNKLIYNFSGETWNLSPFAFDILFCKFVQSKVEGQNTYFELVNYDDEIEPDLQILVERGLREIENNALIEYESGGYEDDYCLYIIPYFFKYHCDNAKSIPEFLRNAIKTVDNAWSKSKIGFMCRDKFNEWLHHTIREYNLDINDIVKSTTGVQPPQRKNKAVTGFDLGFTAEQLTSLYKTLVDEKFLDRKTKLEHFKNAFNGEVLEEGHFEPLKWIKTKTTLSLFIGSLNYQNKWKIAETIFENCNGRNLNKALSNNDGLEIHKKNIKLFRNILA